MALKSSRAEEESPPRSKKLSSTPMEGSCSTRCQIGVSASIIAEVGSCFKLHMIRWNLPQSPSRSSHFPGGLQHDLVRRMRIPVSVDAKVLKAAQCSTGRFGAFQTEQS